MFHINYETAKAEVARRHERLNAAQRSGLAYEPRARREVGLLSKARGWFSRPRAVSDAPAGAGSGEPCVTC